jgi:arylsulfatase
MGAFQDFLPTITDVAGISFQNDIDGLSFYPTLIGQNNQAKHPHLYWEFPSYGGQVAVRMGKWKAIGKGLLKKPDNPLELYNLEHDIEEQNNVAEENPEFIQQIWKKIKTSRIPSEKFPFPALDSLTQK